MPITARWSIFGFVTAQNTFICFEKKNETNFSRSNSMSMFIVLIVFCCCGAFFFCFLFGWKEISNKFIAVVAHSFIGYRLPTVDNKYLNIWDCALSISNEVDADDDCSARRIAEPSWTEQSFGMNHRYNYVWFGLSGLFCGGKLDRLWNGYLTIRFYW